MRVDEPTPFASDDLAVAFLLDHPELSRDGCTVAGRADAVFSEALAGPHPDPPPSVAARVWPERWPRVSPGGGG